MKEYPIKISVTKNNTHIQDSYLVKDKKDMEAILSSLKKSYPEDYAINVRSMSSMIKEWRAHNLLYKMGVQKERTKDVDLDMNETWCRKLGYSILSLFYW